MPLLQTEKVAGGEPSSQAAGRGESEKHGKGGQLGRGWAAVALLTAPGTLGGCLAAICGIPGVYGNLGIAAAGNASGGRTGPANWTDSDGNVWIFAGFGFDSAGTLVYLNDLWRYNPSTNQWGWMGGPSTVTGVCFGNSVIGTYSGGEPGVYGTRGEEATANIPGERSEPVTWVDQSGNFWLMGGYHIDGGAQAQYVFDDLWRFNPSSGEWAWMGGAAGPRLLPASLIPIRM